MSDLLKKHPEILRFEEDQMEVTAGVQRYVDTFVKKHPTVLAALSKFRRIYSKTGRVSKRDLERLFSLEGWTHTDTQQRAAIDFLRNVARNYPTPPAFANHKPGLYLDISKETNVARFSSKLDRFILRVQRLPKPKTVSMSLEEIGRLPLSLIHRAGSSDFVDPVLGDAVKSVWTLDVSANPGLSIKDLIAKQMIEDGIKTGEIRKNTILVEGTSGNTGMGIALMAGVLGYKTILIIPDKMSEEKIERMQSMGAHMIVTPTKVDADDPKSYYSVRDYVSKKVKGWSGNQYHNLSNVRSHQKMTGPAIWDQSRGKVTAVVGTMGTCGTLSGVARFLKKKNPKIKVVGIDSVGSIMYLLKEGYRIEEVQQYARGYKIQGYGEDIHPKNLDLKVIDRFIRVGDKTGLWMAQLLPALGYVVGQSSGGAYGGLVEAIRQKLIGKMDNVVTIFPDIGFAYRKDLYSDTWMKKNGFLLDVWA